MIRQHGRGTLLAIPLLALPAIGWAAEASPPVVLDSVTVLGTRTPRPSDAIPRSVGVVDSDRIAHAQSGDPGAAVDALPNVSLTGSPRPVGEGIRIRGLSDDRVLLLIDGVRQGFTGGHLGAPLLEPDLIKRIEVERGPASVLWGSGALGGVVSVETRDAVDLLAPDQTVGARLRGGYQSATDGWLGSAAVYGRLGERVDALVYAGRRDNGNLELGNGETLQHSAHRRDSVLAKTTFYPAAGQSVGLSHHRLRLDGETPSNPATPESSSNPVEDREIALDSTQLDWRLMPQTRWMDLRTRIFHSATEVDEHARSIGRSDRTAVDTLGVDVTNTSRFGAGVAGDHALTYGVDGYRNRAEASRNGGPRPGFPDATRHVVGAFVQDEIDWGDWTTTLGLRYDRYRSESEDDVAPEQEDSALSSQLGVLWRTTDWLSVYASYAEAFRAPSLSELYATGTHFGANRFVPNPGLEPERAANREIGLRTRWNDLFTVDDRLALRATAFRNDVEDFIDTMVSVQPLPFPPFVGGTTRSENVTAARLEGFEVSGLYHAGAWFVGLGYGRTRGYNETAGEPLADIAPDQWVLRAGLTALPWNGRITWRVTHARHQDRVPPGVPETAGYTVHDLLTSWHPSRNLRLDFGVGNLTDKAYRRHNAVIDEAGRNVKASLTWKF